VRAESAQLTCDPASLLPRRLAPVPSDDPASDGVASAGRVAAAEVV
jgi:hypothetical protein